MKTKEFTVRDVNTIDIYTKWCIDRETLIPYYARKIIVNENCKRTKVFVVEPKLGRVSELDGDGIQQMLGMDSTYKFTTKHLMRAVGGWERPSARIKYNYYAKRVNDPKSVENPLKYRHSLMKSENEN